MNRSNLLIVEDEYLVAEMLREALLDLGAETVHAVPSVRAALDVLEHHSITAAVLVASLIVPIHTRWGDMDVFHHINNVAYARYLEDARAYFLEQAGRRAVDDDHGHIVQRNEIDYLHQMEYRIAPYDMELWVDRIAAASYVLAYELRDDQHIYMKARTTMVCLNMRTERPTRLPAEYLQLLQGLSRG